MGLLLIAAPGLGLSGCDRDNGTPAAATSTTEAESTSTTGVSTEDQVLADYRAFWDAYLAAADPMDPESPLLREHATGKELETVQRAFIARRAGGEVIRGELDLAPRVASVLGESATVRDCYLDNTGIYDAATGARKDTATGVRHLITATLALDAGTWKVSDLAKEGDGCTAA